MKYGYFDNANKEYVITTPKTPYPWINYLGNESFFSLMSNTAGGYSFFKDARKRRITRYRYNDVPLDCNGKYFYINDGKDIWSPSWKPTKTPLDFYECRHGMGYTKISGQKNDLLVKTCSLVPLEMDCEVTKVTLSNKSNVNKTISLFSFAEFCLWEAMDDMTNFQRNLSTGEVEVEGSAIYHKTEYRERRNHYAFYWCNTNIDGFDTQRDDFLGLYNGYDSPEAVKNNKSTNSIASGWSPIASHNIKVDLKAGETKEFIFVLGYIENEIEDKFTALNVINKKKAVDLQNCFTDINQFNKQFEKLQKYWDELLGKYTIESSDEKLNTMVNIWNQYQCMVTFNMSRSASYFESGIGRGMGFRDSNQDLVGIVHQIPDRARERIIDIASTQFKDGSAYHQYQTLSKKGNSDIGSGFNDDPLWLIFGVNAYINETGDIDILNQSVPFDDDKSPDIKLIDHLKVSFDHVVNNLGPHKLPLIGRADWNDCLNLNCFSDNPDESFQTCSNVTGGSAESVFIGGMFVDIGKSYVEMCKSLNNQKEADYAQQQIDKMYDSVIEHGYDGEWFLRAYDYYGNKVGSNENDEGKIFIESQGYCVMAGIGVKEGYAQKALDSVDKYLNTKYGIVLNYPAYTTYHKELGEISTYPQGYKENGGIFCHNNPWVAIAHTVLGNGDNAFDVYSKIAPAYLEDISDIHKTEPYVYSQMIAGKEAILHGQAKNSWLTGTAAWNYYAITNHILGIKPQYNGLLIDPCIPKDMKGYKIFRKFRNNSYNIEVLNPNGASIGIKKLTVDGVEVCGNLINYVDDGKTHEVVATMS